MTVIVAENTPDKVRGLLKRWFMEPKPNLFVGSVNRRIREKVLQYILRHSPDDLALLVIFDEVNSQGFRIRHYRDPSRCERLVSGHYLLALPMAAADLPHLTTAEEIRSRIWERYADCFISYAPKA